MALFRTITSRKSSSTSSSAGSRIQITRAPGNSAYYLMLGQGFLLSRRIWRRRKPPWKRPSNSIATTLVHSSCLPIRKLLRWLVTPGRADRRREVRQNSRDLRGYMLLGILEENAGDWQKARDTYQQALQIDPRFGVGANNLASVLLDHGGDVNVALALAQTARRGMPDSPNSADTLAWAEIQEGVYGVCHPALAASPYAVARTIPPTITISASLTSGMKNATDAAAQFRQVLKLEPGYAKGRRDSQVLGRIPAKASAELRKLTIPIFCPWEGQGFSGCGKTRATTPALSAPPLLN